MSKTAFIFPGQGSQAIGMGVALSESSAEIRSLYDQSSQVLGWDFLKTLREGPEDRLRQTDVAQPALYVTGYAAALALKEQGIQPDAVAGHSIGEYSALAIAGVIGFGEGLALVRERGRLMQEAAKSRPGAMAAVLGLSEEQLASLCAQSQGAGVCVPVNFNSPEQIVIAGEKAAIDQVSAAATAAGAKRVIALNVSGAFHSPLMEPAANAMRDLLIKIPFHDASVPVAMNVDGQVHREARDIQDALARQLDHAVRWTTCIESLKREGCSVFVECGAGKVLSGLLRRIDKALQAYNTDSPEAVAETGAALSGLRKGTV